MSPTSQELYEQLGLALANDAAQLADMQETLDKATDANGVLAAERDQLKEALAKCHAGDDSRIRWGVASHQCTYRDPAKSVYAEDEKLFAMHDKLGGPHLIRDMLFTGGDTVWNNTILPNMKRHGEAGRTFELTLGNWKGMATYDFIEASLRLRQLADLGLLSGVAGINEPDDSDNGGVNFDMRVYAAHQKKIWDMMQADPVLRQIPVACGAIRGENTTWGATNAKFIAANKPYMNEFNWHWYPLAGNVNMTEQQLRDEWEQKMTLIRSNWAGPIYISECGATTGNPGVDPERQKWVDMMMLTVAEEDDVKVIIYEIACDKATISTAVQRNFGIFNYDGTPRPAAVAIAAR